MTSVLLPSNSTPLERAVADAAALPPVVLSGADAIATAKHVTRPPTFLPFLHHEYGLSELAPYLTNPYVLLDEGRQWQLIRGTVPAIDLALSWLDMAAAVEEVWTGRRFWNAFTLLLTTLPANDLLLLDRIENLADLSTPQRSRMKRGVHGYDVRALEADCGRLDHAQLDFDSGIKASNGTRHFREGATWSFGRTHEHEHSYTEREGHALGNWVEPTDSPLPWLDFSLPWLEWTTPWTDDSSLSRSTLLSTWFQGRRLYLVLRDGDGAVIGYRRARAVWSVAQESQGVYSFGGEKISPAASGTELYVEAMTQFDDANGVTAASIGLLVDPVLADGVSPGRLWLQPGEASGGVEIATHEINVPLRRTVRERFKFLIGFDGPFDSWLLESGTYDDASVWRDIVPWPPLTNWLLRFDGWDDAGLWRDGVEWSV